jgi:uncharacterized protein (TIGR00661 family)
MRKAKILYGVCGIGMGHTYRQLPLLDNLAAEAEIVLFAYGESLAFYSKHFAGNPNVHIVRVSVPFYYGNADGLDKVKTRQGIIDDERRGIHHWRINMDARNRMHELIGKPDFCVSDYCPMTARMAYATGAPLVTIDQQSKYLVGDYTEVLGGTTSKDEVERLRLFFPEADLRLACSFFRVPLSADAREEVTILPPIIKPAIVDLKNRRAAIASGQSGAPGNSVVVYISSQREFVQPLEEVLEVLKGVPEFNFNVYVKELPEALAAASPANVKLRRHGDPRFLDHLAECRALISTGGHSLVSEVMFLGIPAYLIPLAVYEQQVNSHIVGRNGFGVCADNVNLPELRGFLANLDDYAENIRRDETVLVRGSGEAEILDLLKKRFLERA